MDQQAATLLATLKKPAAPSEAKVNALNALKSDIKHYRVPESAQSTIFDCLKLAITQQASSTLASTAFSTLSHLLKRLKIQDASGNSIRQLAPRLLPSLQDRLGDLREPVRTAASQALTDLYPFLTADVEELVRDEAIVGSNVRAKEAAILWVVRMHTEEAMPFKAYVSSIVARLEDADGNVRETAKHALIELFKSAPDRAKVDLKRQLKAHSVRHAIESQILAQINTPSSSHPAIAGQPTPADSDMLASTRSLPAMDGLAESTTSEGTVPPSQEQVVLDPLYVHSQRELEDLFRDMAPSFEGKETEHNWMPRDKAVLKLRRLVKGNAPSEYHTAFMAGLKSTSEGILKVANSLRTTMSTNGCQLVQELARTIGPALDPHVELFLQTFVKMSAATKHIAAEHGRVTSDAIFQNCSYHVRLMQHIWSAAQEKNAQLRQCVPDWLKTILRRQAAYKSQFEHSGGLDLADKCIKKGLDDANPKVKEGMRSTYWVLAKTWPDKAEAIMNKLDPKSRAALEKDPNNPNVALHTSVSAASTTTRGSGVASRNTLRELMAEQRKAKAAGRLDRPNSAMASVTPMKAARSEANLKHASRQPSNLSQTHRAERVVSTASSTSATPADSSASAKRSALMSGPVRRPRRQEIQRPQTADPYASKKLLRPETPASNASPGNSPPKGTDRSNKSSIPSSSAIRDRVRPRGAASPSASPIRRSQLGHPSPEQTRDSRPSSKHSNATQEEDLTIVMASGRSGASSRGGHVVSPHKRPGQSLSVDRGIPSNSEEDFTMVMPGGQNYQPRAGSPLAYRSPLKAMFEEARDKLERSASPPLTNGPMNSLDEALESDATRRESPSRGLTQMEDVQVYEDSFDGDVAETSASGERKVLGELPVNENASVVDIASHSPERSANGVSQSALASPDRGEILKNKRLLTSGIERIRTKTLDAHGLRRVQDLAKSPLDIWEGGAKYDELMSVLLDYLQTLDRDPKTSSQPASKTVGLKAQAIGLVRALLTVHRKYAVSWHARTLAALLVFRQSIDSTSHLLTDLEKACEDIVKQGTPEPCVNAVLDILPQIPRSGSSDAGASRAIAMALVLLRQLLSGKKSIPGELKIRLTQTAAKYLDAPDAEVRKADVELASELFELFGSSKTEFWTEFKGTDEGRLGLLTYYIARNSKKEGSRSKAAVGGS